MNTSEKHLTLSLEEHEVLLDALNSYYNIVRENIPIGFEEIFPSNDDFVIRFNALTTIREKAVNTWSARFYQ